MTTCAELKKKIEDAFNDVMGQSKTGNITDDMIKKTSFTELVAEARERCNMDYSIKWDSNKGNYLHEETWRS